MERQFERTVRLIGEAAQQRIKDASIAVFGIGGVGSYAAEALCRAGIGKMAFIDADVVDETNINRQLIATHNTIGQPKCEIMRKRVEEINPGGCFKGLKMFYGPDTADAIDLAQYDYVIDAIDSVTSKILLIERCYAAGTNIISAMGAGNKLDPSRFKIADIYETKVCPLARVMRRELKKRGIDRLKVVYSDEEPISPAGDARLPASISFVPSAAGLVLAGAVIRDIAGI